MSAGLICDQCGETLVVNDRGDSETGEEAGWLKIRTVFASFDVCTRSCAVALIESDEFAQRLDAGAEIIAEITGAIRNDDGVEE